MKPKKTSTKKTSTKKTSTKKTSTKKTSTKKTSDYFSRHSLVRKNISNKLAKILDSGIYGDTIKQSSTHLAEVLEERGMT